MLVCPIYMKLNTCLNQPLIRLWCESWLVSLVPHDNRVIFLTGCYRCITVIDISINFMIDYTNDTHISVCSLYREYDCGVSSPFGCCLMTLDRHIVNRRFLDFHLVRLESWRTRWTSSTHSMSIYRWVICSTNQAFSLIRSCAYGVERFNQNGPNIAVCNT